jgi:hypothetical protein
VQHHNKNQEMIVCQNCGNEGDKLYCPGCGQLLEAKRITFHHLMHEVAHTFWHLEKGFLYTLKELGRNPGTKGIFIRYPVTLSKAFSIVCNIRNSLCTGFVPDIP